MATEAQKLIGLSLTKIAQSRMNRGGISLHRNLLVATVLQKARFVFMEEAYAASYGSEMIVPQTRCCEAEPRPQQTAESRVASGGEQQERPRRLQKRQREIEDSESFTSASAKRSCDQDVLQQRIQTEERLRGSEEDGDTGEDSPEPMEVDRITSLVSVFSFGANSNLDSLARLGRSVSTPDFCSAQAKELDSIQRRTAFAMAV